MAARKLTAEDLKRIQELAKGWGKIIVRQHWGEQGPGLDVDLTEMEDVAMAAVRALAGGDPGGGHAAAGQSTGLRTSLSRLWTDVPS